MQASVTSVETLNATTENAAAFSRDAKRAPRTAPGPKTQFSYYEFFAGGGMVRAGLGLDWECLFANDFDLKKSATYRENWGADAPLATADIRKMAAREIPGRADLAWASFPCQDLSLAGMGAGLKGDRSGTFWPFWELMKKLKAAQRGPSAIVLENVCGTLTSHGGKDFAAMADAFAQGGYSFGAIVVDAANFVPQSRPRLFIVGFAQDLDIPADFVSRDATLLWHPKALQIAYLQLNPGAKQNWVWWKMPKPPRRNTRFADLVEENPSSVPWHSPDETAKLVAMMSDVNRDKLESAKRSGQVLVGTIYKRTRFDEDDEKVQRAEIRFDDIAGCLRTSSGGSSRQLIMIVKGDSVRSRLLSSREAARLMGLPETYKLPKGYNEAYHLTGDGVVVPVVRYLATHLLEPVIANHHVEIEKSRAADHSVRKEVRPLRAN